MSMNAALQAETLEEQVLETLRTVVTAPDGPDIVGSGAVYAVVATGGAVRVLIDPDRIPAGEQEPLAEFITPLVEALPGVERVVVKPRPRSVAQRPELPDIARVVAVHSGKGGVGKSTVAVNLACALAAAGYRVGLLDADVYGPSAPTLLGLSGRAETTADGLRIRPLAAHGVRVMSLGFLLPEGQALIWRGSLVDQGLPQLFTDVDWGGLDVLLVDLPPGTSDVHLAAARQVVLAGVVTVTAPGQLSVDDVRRGMEMFADLAVPCLGVVENLAALTCRRCGAVGKVFGSDGGAGLAAEVGVPLLARLPFLPALAASGDAGVPVVVGEPDSLPARIFTGLARSLAGRIGLRQEARQSWT